MPEHLHAACAQSQCGTLAVELVAADRGIGFMVQSAAQFLITDTVILGIIVIAVVAVALELLLRNLQKQLSPWYGQQL